MTTGDNDTREGDMRKGEVGVNEGEDGCPEGLPKTAGAEARLFLGRGSR